MRKEKHAFLGGSPSATNLWGTGLEWRLAWNPPKGLRREAVQDPHDAQIPAGDQRGRFAHLGHKATKQNLPSKACSREVHNIVRELLLCEVSHSPAAKHLMNERSQQALNPKP